MDGYHSAVSNGNWYQGKGGGTQGRVTTDGHECIPMVLRAERGSVTRSHFQRAESMRALITTSAGLLTLLRFTEPFRALAIATGLGNDMRIAR